MTVVKISVAETEKTVKFLHGKYIADRPAESSVSYEDVESGWMSNKYDYPVWSVSAILSTVEQTCFTSK